VLAGAGHENGARALTNEELLQMVAGMLAERPRPFQAARQRSNQRLKRLVDLGIGLPLAILSLPLITVAALGVLIVDRHAPFYADTRIGRRGRAFRCLKLRTMRADPAILAEYLAANPHETETYRVHRKLKFDPRVTPLGSFFRRTSIDELPQLWNVLRGDMSVVGPRPLAPGEFLERGRRALPLTLVRPGLTGLWQVRGRSDLSLRRRIALDNYYALRWTPWLDLKILVATPPVVLRAQGAR
jgi:exopolysaccharide production protein ExoY